MLPSSNMESVFINNVETIQRTKIKAVEMNEVSSDLINAVRQGDVQEATRLIEPCLLRHSTEGYDLLMIALENKNSAMAKLLLTRDCLVRNRKRRIHDTPLHLAVRNGDLEIISLLLDKGASSDEENQNGETPIGIAVEKGCLQTVELLLNHTSVDCTVKGYLGLLHIALGNEMKTNFDEMVNLLLKKFVDMLDKTKGSPRTLHMAAKFGSKEIVNFLLQQGYQVDGQDDDGKTVLFYAVARGDLTIVETVLMFHPDINNPSNQMCLKTAVCCNGKDAEEIILALFDYGFTITPENAKDLQFLHGAVEKGNYEILSYLLENGSDPNAVCERPSQFKFLASEILSPLHRAVRKGHERVAELLIKYRADVNALDENGIPPIFYSVDNVDLTMTQLLLNNGAALHFTVLPELWEMITDDMRDTLRSLRTDDYTNWLEVQLIARRGANTNRQNKSVGLTTLHVSVMKRSEKMVDLLLRNNVNVNAADDKGVTALHISVEQGNLEITTLLLDYGADANVQKVDGNTPLHLAVTGGHSEVVKLLLERGAWVNSEGVDGKTPLLLAAERDNSLKCSANAGPIDGESVNISAVRRNVEITEALLEFGAEVNSICLDGKTALHFSVVKGSEKMVEILLRYNVRVNEADEKGVTALHICAEQGNLEITTLLLDNGAYVNAKEENGITPLNLAVTGGHNEVVKLLLERGAQGNSKGPDGNTPLHLAVTGVHSQVVKLLLARGAQVNSEDGNGKTPLLLAAERDDSFKCSANASSIDGESAERRNVEIIEALLEFGAEVNSRCVDGKTALHYSSLLGCTKIVTTLIEYGADVNILCKNYETPLDCATIGFYESRPTQRCYNQCEETVHYLNRHHVKLEAAGLVAAEFWPSIDEFEEKLDDFRTECQLELTRTKSEFIEDTNESYYDILKKDSRCVAKYMKNPSVMLAAESEDYRKTFPLYASIIKCQFRKGSEIFKLLESASQVVNCISIQWIARCLYSTNNRSPECRRLESVDGSLGNCEKLY